MNALKAKCSMSEREALKDIHQNYIKHPLVQSKVRISANEAAGSASLGWYRGHQAGVYDAYLTIRKRFPRVARELLRAFEMDEKGNL